MPISTDRHEDNKDGFGPKVAGVQLGMKMTLRDIISWRAGLRGFPFTLEVNSKVKGKKLPATGSISILFTGNDEYSFEVTNATKGFYRFKNEKMRLSDLLAEIERAGIATITLRGENVRVKENCVLFDDRQRISSIHLRKSDFGWGSMTHERFVELLTKTYNLPKMRRRGSTWRYSNDAEGWQISYHTFGEGILEIDR